jgi:hypothetical protein
MASLRTPLRALSPFALLTLAACSGGGGQMPQRGPTEVGYVTLAGTQASLPPN